MITTGAFGEALALEVTALQASFPDLAAALSRAHALLMDGRLFPEDDGRSAMVRSSDDTTWYAVNGHCTCPASTARSRASIASRSASIRRCPTVWPLRRSAMTLPSTWPLLQRTQRLPRSRPTISPLSRDGRLLSLKVCSPLPARGLVALSTTIVTVSDALAVCQSIARFQDGRVFTDIGDASPTNVARHLAPHFVRMAGTRAAARALRRALNIAACAVEELGEEA